MTDFIPEGLKNNHVNHFFVYMMKQKQLSQPMFLEHKRTMRLPRSCTYTPYLSFLQHVVLPHWETNYYLWHPPPCGGNGLAPRQWDLPVNNQVGPSIVNHRGVLYGWRLWRIAWEWHVLHKAAWLCCKQTLGAKEGSFVHDGWWPSPLYVSYGIWILKGSWTDERHELGCHIYD